MADRPKNAASERDARDIAAYLYAIPVRTRSQDASPRYLSDVVAPLRIRRAARGWKPLTLVEAGATD